jgi:hypothetical protein
VVARPYFSSLRGESSLDEVSAQMMTLFVLYVLTGVAAVVALVSLAFGPFVLPERVVTPLALLFSLLAIGGVVAIALLMLPRATG